MYFAECDTLIANFCLEYAFMTSPWILFMFRFALLIGKSFFYSSELLVVLRAHPYFAITALWGD